MANELEHIDASGLTLYAKPTPIVASPWATDTVAMSEVGTTGYYSADVATPANSHVVYEQAGGSAADTDLAVGTITIMRGTDGANTVAPDNAGIAAAVRTELTTELARIDTTVSSRSSHTAENSRDLIVPAVRNEIERPGGGQESISLEVALVTGRLTDERAGKLDNIQATGTVATTAEAVSAPAMQVDATDVNPSRTWRVKRAGRRHLAGEVTVAAGTDGTLQFDLEEALNPRTAIVSVLSVASDPTLSLTNARLSPDYLRVLIDTPELTAGAYEVVITIQTTDAQQLPIRGTLIVE